MQTQDLVLDIVPGGVPPVIDVTQYDTARGIKITLSSRTSASFSLSSNYTYELRGTRANKTGFIDTEAVSMVDSRTLIFTTTGTMTSIAGECRCGILIFDGDEHIETINFIMQVHRASLEAETIVNDQSFESIIKDAVEEVIDEQGLVIDDQLETPGAAADAKVTGDEIRELKNAIEDVSGLSDEAKEALLDCFAHVAWIDEHGQDYYDALEEALYNNTWQVMNLLTHCTTSNAAQSVTKGGSYSATITASAGYVMTGATISITMGGNDITATAYNNGVISIPVVTGALVITISAAAKTVSSISAVFSQGQDTSVTVDTTRIYAYIGTNETWVASDESYSICVPVTVGKQYALSWSVTDSTSVSAIFRWGFSDTTTPAGQTLSGCFRTTPQDYPYAETDAADKPYLVIQIGSSGASGLVYLSVTELAYRVYTNDSLDVLKDQLVVTATYADSSTATVPTADYALSGTLAEGTQTITVSYGGQTDTFTVACTVKGYLYHFEQSLASAGSRDFGWSGTENYGTGYDGTGYSYQHKADSETDYGTIKNTSLTASQMPDLSGDFTIAGWSKTESVNTYYAYILASIKYNTTASATTVTNALSSSSIKNLAAGWTADVSATESARYKGVRFQSLSGNLIVSLFAEDGTNRARVNLTPPSTLDCAEWHHYAITRSSGTVYVFVDGNIICSFAYSKAIAFSTQVATAAAFKADASNPGDTVTMSINAYTDDLFVADYAKWTTAFDPVSIVY